MSGAVMPNLQAFDADRHYNPSLHLNNLAFCHPYLETEITCVITASITACGTAFLQQRRAAQHCLMMDMTQLHTSSANSTARKYSSSLTAS